MVHRLGSGEASANGASGAAAGGGDEEGKMRFEELKSRNTKLGEWKPRLG